jgi:hypothetical protein
MFKIAFMELTCKKETSDRSDSDEVYAVIFVGDATTTPPQTRVFRSKVFTGVDQNNVRKQWIRVWGINGAPTEIADPNRLLILCGLMESDSSEPSNVHAAVDQAATAAFTLSIVQGVGHGAMASRVGNAMLTGMRTGAFVSFSPPSSPDDIIDVDEVRFSQNELDSARGGSLVTKEVKLTGQDGEYRALFHLRFGPDE